MESQGSTVERKREPLYSWCIAFACFWLSFLTVGLHRSAGIIYVSVVQVFNISREQAIWPLSLCGSLMCLLGKFSLFLGDLFSRLKKLMLKCKNKCTKSFLFIFQKVSIGNFKTHSNQKNYKK